MIRGFAIAVAVTLAAPACGELVPHNQPSDDDNALIADHQLFSDDTDRLRAPEPAQTCTVMALAPGTTLDCMPTEGTGSDAVIVLIDAPSFIDAPGTGTDSGAGGGGDAGSGAGGGGGGGGTNGATGVDETSFYACATSRDATGALPIAFVAIVIALRRRRRAA